MKYIIYPIILFVISLQTGCRGKQSIIDSLAAYEWYAGKYIGISNKISPQWKDFEVLVNRFSESELVDLCKHEKPIVRCYAFRALAENYHQKVFNVLLEHLSDTVSFNSWCGCLSCDDNVIDNYLQHVGYYAEIPSVYKLTPDQIAHIDSTLLFSEGIKRRNYFASIESLAGRILLERIKPQPQFLSRIRELVHAGVYEALPILAQYQNLDDTVTFKTLLRISQDTFPARILTHYIRSSIIHFPHPSFYPILKAQLLAEIGTNGISDHFESFPLYTALVQYPTKETRLLFETALKRSGDETHSRLRSMVKAIKLYPAEVLEPILQIKSPLEEIVVEKSND